MRRWMVTAMLAVVYTSAVADTVTVESRVSAVQLFKNGLAVVQRTVDVPGAGTFRIQGLPAPIHGSFWIGSAAPVAVRVTTEEVEAPRAERATGSLQQDLAGKQVTLYFKDGTIPAVTGKVLGVSAGSASAPPQAPWMSAAPPAPGNFLVLEVGSDRTYVDASMIAYANVRAPGDTVMERRPVLVLDVGESAPPATVSISYIARGLSWAPSYRVDLSDPKSLTIQQQAIIKNELEDLDEAEVSLISGFPSIEFAHVTSPLSLQLTWDAFFQQLQQRPDMMGMNAAVAQQQVISNSFDPQSAFPSVPNVDPQGEGADVHYQPAGTRSLKKGDALMFEVARASADYTRRVEWKQSDTQAEGWLRNGRGDGYPAVDPNAAWDVVAFANPLPFPMTTGPALVVAGDRVLGQNMSYWANSGEPTTIRITKALSIRTHAEEHEVAETRERVVIAGTNYERTTVECNLRVRNQRAEAVEMVIGREFSGALVDAEGEPKARLMEEGAWSVNQRNELTWTFKLAPGEERALSYRYTVLVRQ